ncbi:hypothetical protein HDF18_02865 [Mucilaginibacter sp. X5P1]|uniref:hypothetical protein n=1 Tax=Mucilaginibacter sp. X5P1 TaxID=2723088 RepID=UPI00160C3245|nr:hypothetical protein [Mucilaginibacter sp. X5P1]MBB6137941.1 hypothetical protein [Mucilaginibacter sp. X5P1]
MRPYFYNAVLGLLALVVLLFPFTGKVHDGRHKGWIKGFTKRGWIVCIAFLASIGVNYLKDLQADKDDYSKIQATKTEKRKDDSIAWKRNDESNAKIVSTFTNALAKYNLKYDSAQKVVLKQVRDSARKVITITREEEPNLVLSAIVLKNIENGTYHFNITIVSQKAESEHIFVKLFICSEEDDGYHLMNGITDFYAKDGTLGAGEQFSFNIDLKNTNQLKSFNFLLLGKYKSVNGQTIIVNRIYSYDLSLKNIGIPLEPYYSKIKLFFQQNGIKN